MLLLLWCGDPLCCVWVGVACGVVLWCVWVVVMVVVGACGVLFVVCCVLLCVMCCWHVVDGFLGVVCLCWFGLVCC